MLFDNVEKRESFLFILNKHTHCRREYIAALIKTAQQSDNTSGKVAFILSIFSQVFRRLKHLLMK